MRYAVALLLGVVGLVFPARADAVVAMPSVISGDARASSFAGGIFRHTAGPAGTPVREDNFTGTTLDGRWRVFDPLGDTIVSVSGGALRIALPEGSAHDLWQGALTAPRVLQATGDGDFSIETKFDAAVTTAYQSQGLVAQADVDDLVRFDVFSAGESTRVFAATFVGGEPTVRADAVGPVGAPVYLRMERAGSQWTLSYSADGAIWQTAATFEFALALNEFGLFAANPVTAVAFQSAVDWFRVLSEEVPAPPTDPPPPPPPPDPPPPPPPPADTTPPVIECGSADGVWHADDVLIGCTASDDGSGLADPDDASFALSTSVPSGSADDDALTNSRMVCDVAENCAQAGPVGGNMVDKLAPNNPTRIRSTSHKAGQWASKRGVAMEIQFASDVGSGVGGFSFSWTRNADDVPDDVEDADETLETLVSPTLGNGAWYFHIRTRDKVGNWSSAAHRGPFQIDGALPRVRVLAGRGKVGGAMRLRYRTADAPTGQTRERITIARSGATVASWKRPMAPARWDRLQSVRWTPRSTGTYAFCVRAWDPAGNTRQNCARVRVAARR